MRSVMVMVLAAMTLLAAPAKAEINVAPTIEWLACAAEVIALDDARLVLTQRDGTSTTIELARLPVIYSREQRRVTRREDLLALIERWSKSKGCRPIWDEVAFDAPIHGELYGGSAVYLIVPAEEHHRVAMMALTKSKHVHERERAARELVKFPGPETEAALRALLDDLTPVEATYAPDEIAEIRFPVRAAAYESLIALGQQLPPLPLSRPPTAEEQAASRERYWIGAMREALPGWSVTVRHDHEIAVGDRRRVTITLTVERDERLFWLMLLPIEEPLAHKREYLGIVSAGSQAARRVYAGFIQPEEREKLRAYFGLTP